MAKTAVLDEFGSRVRARRLELALSQEDLGERCGLHRTYIGSIERGERNISLANIVRVAAALGVDPSQLVRGLSEQPEGRRARSR